ncbi:MAG: NADP-dependent oxidoreductase [Sneathiella sp.]|nr:NADP-dependent oxidoreductase [Sneathiella sp.]
MNVKVEERVANYQAASTMKAIGLTRLPEIGRVAENLQMITVPVARPKPDEVAIQVCASSLHIDEIYAAQGTALGRFYGPKNVSLEKPHLMGSSVSGIIVGLGGKTEKFSLGDSVIVIPDQKMEIGSWASYRCVRENMVMTKPKGYSHVEAAAITMAACVAWGAIGFSKTQPGDRCLVVGASGSIGIMLVQYLKTMGCTVTAVCSGKNEAFVKNKGADTAIDYSQQNFADHALSTGILYDRIFDCVGGRHIERDSFRVLKRTGVYETVVGPVQYIGEHKLSWFEFSKVMRYILRRLFVTLFHGPRYMFGEKFPRLVIKDALNRAEKYHLRMPLEKTVPFEIEAVAEAVKLLMTHRAKGRIVINFDIPFTVDE